MKDPKFQALVDEVAVLNIENDKELIRVMNEKVAAMYPDGLDCENRILAGLLAEEVRYGDPSKSKITSEDVKSEEKPSLADKYESYLWIPVHPDFMINKPKESIPLIVCLLEQTAQTILDGIRLKNPNRNDLQSTPSQISLNYLLDFARSHGYSCIRLFEVGQDILISSQEPKD